MTYADSTNVANRIEKLETVKTADPTTLADAIEAADDLIDAELEAAGLSAPSTTPKTLTTAANFLASAEYMDTLTAGAEEASPSAIRWEKKGYKALDAYIRKPTEDHSNSYSRNNSSINRPFRGSKTHRRRGRF